MPSKPLPIRILHGLESGLLITVLGVMILVAFAKIVLPRAFGLSMYWADPLLRHLVLWVGLLGAMVAARTKNHIAVDVINHVLPPRLKNLVQALVGLFVAGVCTFMVLAARRFILDEYEYEMMAFDNIPAWVMELIIPLAFAVIGLRYLIFGLRHAWDAARGSTATLDLLESAKTGHEDMEQGGEVRP